MALRHDAEQNVWHFETEQMAGHIQPDGDRHGIKELTHKPTGAQVVHPKYDLLNLFFMFSQNHCMGQARENERSITSEAMRSTCTGRRRTITRRR